MHSSSLRDRLKESADFLKDRGIDSPDVAVILGSGLNDYADRIENPIVFSYNDIPNMQAGLVSDHRGQLVYGNYLGRKVLLMAGRFHYY